MVQFSVCYSPGPIKMGWEDWVKRYKHGGFGLLCPHGGTITGISGTQADTYVTSPVCSLSLLWIV